MKRVLVFLSVAALLCGGCGTARTPRDFKPTSARFFLESSSSGGTPIVLPQSGVRLTVNSQPVITEGDIVNVELVQVELGKCLLFQLAPSAMRDFYRLTASNQGRRLLVTIDGNPLGARRIDGPITDGSLFVFVELPDDALPALVENLKKSSVAFQRELKRKG